MNMRTLGLIAAVLAAAGAAGPLQAAPLEGQIGILTPETLTGVNPATGLPWAVGDQYRFAFFTSAVHDAVETDIEVYNLWVQGLADDSTVYDIGVDEGVTWKVIGSTNEVDARDNTSTNPEEDGTGHPIFLLDGSTIVANDFEDLWDGEIQHIINLTEQGEESAHWPFTGTYKDGTKAPGHPSSQAALGSTGEVGQGQSSVTTNWIWRTWTSAAGTEELNFYAMSDPLTIVSPSLPGDANGDGFVDDSDLSLLLSSWQQDTDWAHGEFSGEPPVNDDDLSLLLSNWTGSAPAGMTVPEPASLAVLAIGGLAVLARRRN